MILTMESVEGEPICQKMAKDQSEGGMPLAEIRFIPSRIAMPKTIIPFVDRLKNFEVRPDDTWVITFPKCGTTWTQEMVWLIGNGYNFEKALSEDLPWRFPFLEFSGIESSGAPDTLEYTEKLESPRFIKSHLHMELLPSQLWTVKPKIIYVYRNPKDAAVSYYHHYRLWNNYNGPQDDFIDAFLQELVVSSPFWKHALAFWEKRHEPNILFIRFEELKQDLKSVARAVAGFLGSEIPANIEQKLLDHLSFAEMSKNPRVNFEDDRRRVNKLHMNFIRQGESGAWKKALTPKQVQRFDDWSNEWIKGTDFPYYI